MNDADVYDVARRAGIAVEWTDYTDRRQRVGLDTIRHILTALGLPCYTDNELAHSRNSLDQAAPRPLITATLGLPAPLPVISTVPRLMQIVCEDGSVTDLRAERTEDGITLPPVATVGYHRIEFGEAHTMLAVAPPKCLTISDLAPGEHLWGLAAQVYGLRSCGDCGIGDMAGVIALAQAAAGLKADALALSPTHALFSAYPPHFGPYSPSSRLFYNPLHADPAAIFSQVTLSKARADSAQEATTVEDAALIDWPRSSQLKMTMFRRLFDDFLASHLSDPATSLGNDFRKFRAEQGSRLAHHGIFEALHAARLKNNANDWNWREWPAEWRDASSPAMRKFADEKESEILFHIFLQWIADRSMAQAQQRAIEAGMRVGLITDLAVGMNTGGSEAWSSQEDVLSGLQVGAPRDLFNSSGQNWGLTTLSPRALLSRGFEPFIATLRACLRHAGGVRIDHVMGLMRLWVIPHGAKATEGAYLLYPLTDLLRLTALESLRHRAIVVGENLGTVPTGFRDRLAASGIHGMSVLWFERNRTGFAPPRNWAAEAVAMTSTHDLPTVAGWWHGHDLETRAACGFVQDLKKDQAARRDDRQALWKALCAARAASRAAPAPDQSAPVVDAAIKFVAQTPSRLVLLPLEDVLALEDQPNLPGTTDEQPNWRRRYPDRAGKLLDPAPVSNRLRALAEQRHHP
jgi:4-alpha-glucanotransferase